MHRVLVIGCPGAGKSTFARQLARRTGLPLVHLDRHYWSAGWQAPPPAQWTAQVEQLAAAPRWVMDGNYGGTLPLRLAHADTVVFLDLPGWLCLARVLWRTLRDLGRTRADMAPGCRERFNRAFLRYVWHYRRDHRPRVLAHLQGFHGTLAAPRTPSEAAAFLARLDH